MNKVVKQLALAIAIAMTCKSSVYAVPQNNSVDGVSQSQKSVEVTLEHLDSEIEKTMLDVEKNKKQIEKLKKDLQSSQKELSQTEDKVKMQQDLLGKRMRAMYINGGSSYLMVIMESDSLGDLLSRIENVKIIVENDQNSIIQMQKRRDEIKAKKAALEKQKLEVTRIKNLNENKLAQLNEKKIEQKKLAEEANRKEKLIALDSVSQSHVNAAMSNIKDIRNSTSTYIPSRGATAISGNSIIAYASNFLGTPYVWGGTSPVPGFDCSGFTQYVLAHFGIVIDRTTYGQINDGLEVPRAQLQPGDLVFFGSWNNPHHVGIYVGNGSYIHAPRTGESIKVSPLNRGDYVTARRVR